MEKTEEIDFMKYFRVLIKHRKTIYKTVGIGLLIGIVIAFSIPKTYTVKITLSPESGQSDHWSGGRRRCWIWTRKYGSAHCRNLGKSRRKPESGRDV